MRSGTEETRGGPTGRMGHQANYILRRGGRTDFRRVAWRTSRGYAWGANEAAPFVLSRVPDPGLCSYYRPDAHGMAYLETTRGWCERTVLRVAPCLFGLYSVVALLYAQLPANRTRSALIAWPGKNDRTFSDAITAVRRELWMTWAFVTSDHHGAFSKLSRSIRAMLLYALAPAA